MALFIRQLGLIAFEYDIIKANFLEITVSLHNNIYLTFHRPSTNLRYSNAYSTHDLSIIPNLISVLKLSANIEIIKESAEVYDTALSKVGYAENLDILR